MVGDVVIFIERSDGQTMTLGDGEWRIPNDGLENWANLSYSVSSAEIPSYDGAVVTSKRVNSQDRSIRAQVGNTADNERLRAEAIAFFSPKFTYKCHLTYMGRTRWCEGEQIGFRASEGNIYEPVEIDWSILCPNPYLQSEDDFGEDIAYSLPMIGFPFMSFLPVEDGSVKGCNVGFLASIHEYSQEVEIENNGDVPSGMRFIIKAQAPVKNPMVKIGDNYVRALKTMNSGDVLEIDLTTRPPEVLYNGKNAMQILDRKSNILSMWIDVGTTKIEYDADDGYQSMQVFVYYNKQYLGI